MKVRIVTPDKLVFDGVATYIYARGVDGDFAILPNHVSMITPLGLGQLRVDHHESSVHIAIDNGILEITNNQINILTNDAMMGDDIDSAKIKMELEQLERQKQNAKNREELIKSETEILKLINRLRVGELHSQ